MHIEIVTILSIFVGVFIWMYFAVIRPFFKELLSVKEDIVKLSFFLNGVMIKFDQLERKIYNYEFCSKCPMFENCYKLNEHRIEQFGNLIKDLRNVTLLDVFNQVNELCNTCYLFSKEYASITEKEIDIFSICFKDLEFKVEYNNSYECWVGTCSIFPKMSAFAETKEKALNNIKEYTKKMIDFRIKCENNKTINN